MPKDRATEQDWPCVVEPILDDPIAVIDFETTGLSPAMGDRATEIAIVLLEGGEVVGRFQSLMNAGVRISSFIESFTGISNAMVQAAPPAAEVMAAASRFVGDAPMVAHNAGFDRRYWQAELARMDLPAAQPFACTVLLSRRLHPEARRAQAGCPGGVAPAAQRRPRPPRPGRCRGGRRAASAHPDRPVPAL
jgi:DNA polymerase III epsilon subunit-like protein